MSIDIEKLKAAPRVLIEADLKPVAGTRFQPTGFPDLGPALYETPDGTPTLLVESAQSMANHLESVCWDEATENVVQELTGIPYVKVKLVGLGDGTDTTCSLLEFHRLNSPYIMSGLTGEGASFNTVLSRELGLVGVAAVPGKQSKTKTKDKVDDASVEESSSTDKERNDVAGVVNLRKLAAICFKYDPNSLVHGVFLEKIAGRLRHPRALSAFIEASGAARADSGGVKFDRVLPKPSVAGVDAKGGYGNVPFHRTEFTAKNITAFFSVDLAQIRGYGLPSDATKLLITLSLWKVRKFLDSNMRLRTACELELVAGKDSIRSKRPDGFVLPSADYLGKELGSLIPKCDQQFAKPIVTELTWNNPKG
jgi:CRISPR-associated protein Csb1